MKITTIQSNIVWEDKVTNIKNYQNKIDRLQSSDLIILPEMFTTGFTMNPKPHAETMTGSTVEWMKENAIKHNLAVCGSIIITEEDKYFNRFIWVNPDASIQFYDKRHLFSFAGEHEKYTPGNSKLVIDYRGWRICPLICYDLRFPVWSRNVEDYDILIYVANWPESRSIAWQNLLLARAIENQCYVVGVNRVGQDQKNSYSGNSCVINPSGETLYQCSHSEDSNTIDLNKEHLLTTREKFPFLKDRDFFQFN